MHRIREIAAFLGISGEMRRAAHRRMLGTGLPKNPACLLIMPPRFPEGDLRESGSRKTLQREQQSAQ
jgi:hypothetical protein